MLLGNHQQVNDNLFSSEFQASPSAAACFAGFWLLSVIRYLYDCYSLTFHNKFGLLLLFPLDCIWHFSRSDWEWEKLCIQGRLDLMILVVILQMYLDIVTFQSIRSWYCYIFNFNLLDVSWYCYIFNPSDVSWYCDISIYQIASWYCYIFNFNPSDCSKHLKIR